MGKKKKREVNFEESHDSLVVEEEDDADSFLSESTRDNLRQNKQKTQKSKNMVASYGNKVNSKIISGLKLVIIVRVTCCS